jgi:hypothetical protein
MRCLNIDIDGVVDARRVKDALNSSGQGFRRVDALIDDVAERRNEIVNSYNTTLELLEAGVLRAYLDVIDAYLREISVSLVAISWRSLPPVILNLSVQLSGGGLLL